MPVLRPGTRDSRPSVPLSLSRGRPGAALPTAMRTERMPSSATATRMPSCSLSERRVPTQVRVRGWRESVYFCKIFCFILFILDVSR